MSPSPLSTRALVTSQLDRHGAIGGSDLRRSVARLPGLTVSAAPGRRRSSRRPSRSPLLKQIDRPGIWSARTGARAAPDHDAENGTGFGLTAELASTRAICAPFTVPSSCTIPCSTRPTISTMRHQQRHMELRGWADIAYFGVGRRAGLRWTPAERARHARPASIPAASGGLPRRFQPECPHFGPNRGRSAD